MSKEATMAADSLDNLSLNSSRLHVMATGLSTHRVEDRVKVNAMYHGIQAAPGLRIRIITLGMHALYVEVPLESATNVARDARR